MYIDKSLFTHIAKEHNIVLGALDLVATGSQAQVIKRQDRSGKFYALKRPQDHTLHTSGKELLHYQYEMVDKFFRTIPGQQLKSYAVGVYDDRPYHVMDRCEGVVKSFDQYTRDEVAALAKSLAQLHNTSINKNIQNFRYYHDAWREYIFHRDGACGVFDRTKKIYPYTLSSHVVRILSDFYQNLGSSRTTITMIHGDLSSNNIILNKGSISLIDPHVVQYGDPIIDVGRILFGIEYAYRRKQVSGRENMHKLFLEKYNRVRQDDTILQYYDISRLYSLGLLQTIATVEENKHHHKELYQWLKQQVESTSS